ncbi:NAD(P)H-dependent oxidoreductase [Staphylococcus delphini]|uniref:NAD(P)H-dependent oxidoreductase n=1 Tax=Staphylococcus delphini TaxID=53344 RepID=UPI000F71ADAD|nr:Acyl carrier protein phosphodiesterase [Staphylococcus delphini]
MKSIKHIELWVSHEQQCIVTIKAGIISQSFWFSPLHNFNVTSRLKDYIDNILIARQTFKYTSDGSVG